MCAECLRTPCHPRCPNAPAPKAIFICSNCGHDILSGDKVFHVLGEQFCKNCIDDMGETAEDPDEAY